MTLQKPVVRLHRFLATRNDTAVFLRQGPSSHECDASGSKDIVTRAPEPERLHVLGEKHRKARGLYAASNRPRPYDVSILRTVPPGSHTVARDRHHNQGGALYRRNGPDLTPIRDFDDMTFEPIRAPYGFHEERQDWRPLAGEGRR